jgi:hypothetical protein
MKPIVVEFKQLLLSPLLGQGIVMEDTMKFVNWNDAVAWATEVTNSKKVPFEILEMAGPEGQVWNKS